MTTPLFARGVRVRPDVLVTAVRHAPSHKAVLVRVYESVNVATTTAAKYNTRFTDTDALTFYVRRLDDDGETYGVYAHTVED